MSKSEKYIGGIDLGGTKIAAVVSTEEGIILAKDKVSTPNGKFSAIAAAMVQSLNRACSSAFVSLENLSAVGVGVPGMVDEKGNVSIMPNLGLKNIAVTAELGELLGKRVTVENDVNLATLSEYFLGAGKGVSSLYGIVPGTGVGGGYVVDGEIVRGKNGTAGEIGHMVVKIDGPICGCGQKGCLEAFVSKVGLARELREANEKREESVLMKFFSNGFEDLDASVLKTAWDGEDVLTRRLLSDQARILGVAVANMVNLTGVEGIVIGGGVYEILGEVLLPIVRKTAEQHAIGGGMSGVQIALSDLGSNAVALGAALLARK